jgi:hypothetical protein
MLVFLTQLENLKGMKGTEFFATCQVHEIAMLFSRNPRAGTAGHYPAYQEQGNVMAACENVGVSHISRVVKFMSVSILSHQWMKGPSNTLT